MGDLDETQPFPPLMLDGRRGWFRRSDRYSK